MKIKAICKIIGTLLIFFSFSMLTPLIIAYYDGQSDYAPFTWSFLIVFLGGVILWFPSRKSSKELRSGDGFVIVFLIWLVMGLAASVPFMISSNPNIPWSDAIFEAISGLTTTGSTIITNIDTLPKAIIFYRQQLEFLGGMGIIVLAVAILPLIGMGGMQLYKAEATGPLKENKLTPRITETAKGFWLIYVGLTLLCILAYWLCGMTPFDAVNYAFSTVATGGFAPHNESIGAYQNLSIYIVCIVFMILGAINFSLHFLFFKRFSIRQYWQDVEVKTLLLLIISATLFVTFTLIMTKTYPSAFTSFIHGLFQVVSFTTTTGFVTTTDYANWPLFIPIILLYLAMIGGCAGSTSGGIKIIRALLIKEQVNREVKYLIHPNGVFPVKLGNRLVPDRVINSTWAFISAYIMIFIILWLLLMATNLDWLTSFSALITCISNAGPGLGQLSHSFVNVNPTAQWILCLAMLIGRLEVFTVLVLISPSFWRQ